MKCCHVSTSPRNRNHPIKTSSNNQTQHFFLTSLTFEHSDFDGSTIWANAVAANTHVSARVRHPDIGDEQSTDVGAVIAGLEKTHRQVMGLNILITPPYGLHLNYMILVYTIKHIITGDKTHHLPVSRSFETTQIQHCWHCDTAS